MLTLTDIHCIKLAYFQDSPPLTRISEGGVGVWVECSSYSLCLSEGRNLSFVQRAGNIFPTLHEGRRGTFNVQRQLVPADGSSGAYIDASPCVRNTRVTIF